MKFFPSEEEIEAARKNPPAEQSAPPPEQAPPEPEPRPSRVEEQLAAMKTVNPEDALGINVRHSSPQPLPKCCSTQSPRAVGSKAGVLECKACQARFELQDDGRWEFTPGREPEPPAEPETPAEAVSEAEEGPAEELAGEPDDGPPTFLLLVDDHATVAREDGSEMDCYKASHHLNTLAHEWSRLVPYKSEGRERALSIAVEIASVAMRAVEDLDILADYDTDKEALFGADEEPEDQG